MNRDKLIAALQQIKILAEGALKENSQLVPRGTKSRKEPDPKLPSANKLPTHILQLRVGGFFKQPRTPKEVRMKLVKIYPCDLNRIEVGLLRIQGRRQLRKTSKVIGKKKQIAYVW